MEVLREHKDSVMAVLEAFVYDPLLNWRLMDSESQQEPGCWGSPPPTMGMASSQSCPSSHTEPKTQYSAATPHFHRTAVVAGNQFQVFLLTKKTLVISLDLD